MKRDEALRTLKGAVALVTGGASGIGRALGESLARQGALVVLADRQGELAQDVASRIRENGGRATAEELDVTDFPATNRLVQDTTVREGRLDYLFNNAGIGVVGEARLYELEDWYRVLLEKTLNRDKVTITERAVIVRQDGHSEEWAMRFVVKEDGTFTLTEDSKRAEGSGKFFGPAWKWSYFKATYKSSNGIQVEDENFLADDSFGTARQKLTGPDNKVRMYMDISFRGITPKTYEILRAGLIKK